MVVLAAAYARISQDRRGNELGAKRQLKDDRELINRMGWSLAGEYVDNDISSKPGVRRPEFNRMLADARAGRINAIAVWDEDRLTRLPIETEELLDLADNHGVRLANVAGEVDLATPGGRLYLRMKVIVARGEVEQKSHRTKRKHQELAENGKWAGGARPFGWNLDMTLIPTEAAEVEAMTRQLLSGATLGSIVRDLNERGITTSLGNPWVLQSLKQVLRRARNAGLAEFHGEVTGPGQWPAIVTEDQWRAVRAVLDDPARRRRYTHDSRVKHFLVGIAVCGVCGEPLKSASVRVRSAPGTYRTVYRCANGYHVARVVEQLDDFTTEIVLGILERPDAADLLVDHDQPDTEPLRKEASEARERLNAVADQFADGVLTAGQLTRITERLRGRLEVLERQLARAPRAATLEELVNARDVRATWALMPLERRRAVIRALITITVDPAGKNGGKNRKGAPHPVRVEPL